MSSNQAAGQPWRQLRVDAGISIRAAEALTGVNRGRLSMIERGWPATPDEAARILTMLAPALIDATEAAARVERYEPQP